MQHTKRQGKRQQKEPGARKKKSRTDEDVCKLKAYIDATSSEEGMGKALLCPGFSTSSIPPSPPPSVILSFVLPSTIFLY
jgi:hypothetical protein